jgi:probable rRNA maturation factor
MPSDRPPLSPPIAVEVSDTQGHLAVDAAALAALARRTLAREGVDHATISIALVDDPSIRAINRRHLDHDWPTDVITFSLNDISEPMAGELVVSAQMAAETARGAGGDPHAELTLYVTGRGDSPGR